MKRLHKIGKFIGYGLGGLLLVLMVTQVFLLRGTAGQTLNTHAYRDDIHYSRVPTLLIPGWGGNTVTYNRLIRTYQRQNVAQKVMTVWVSPRNHIRVSGSWHGQKNALIQVLFDWNYSATYHPQVTQLRHVLIYLRTHYGIKRTNVIAHSYGGTEFIPPTWGQNGSSTTYSYISWSFSGFQWRKVCRSDCPIVIHSFIIPRIKTFNAFIIK